MAKRWWWYIADTDLPDFFGSDQYGGKNCGTGRAENHHPDMDIRYNKLKVALITHDADGLTENDMKMAAILDHLLP
jgi:4a-hydroxytetrahydrobiopterin dehydratase